MTNALIISALVFAIWALIANERTFKQRIEMIPEPEDPDFYDKIGVLRRVSYRQHFLYVLTFRNTKTLYGEINAN